MLNKIERRRFIARHLGAIVQFIYFLKFKLIRFNLPPIIILTPGKVGSSSVYDTLKRVKGNRVFHIHRFSEKGIEESIKEHLDSDRNSKPLHLIVSKLLRKKLESYKGKIFIITIVREPISREVSSFFQNTEFYKNQIENADLKVDENKALSLLLKQLRSGITNDLENWFDDEINQNFGIEVFKNQFDIDKGYSITHHGNNVHLLIKLENLDKTFTIAIKEFLESNAYSPLQNANVGEQKFYAESYKTIKSKVKLDQKTITEILSSRYFQQFYSGTENSIKQKWMAD